MDGFKQPLKEHPLIQRFLLWDCLSSSILQMINTPFSRWTLRMNAFFYVAYGSPQTAFKNVRTFLESKGINAEHIKHITGPLSSRFSRDAKTYFPKAEIHIDRLFILQILNEAVDQVRKQETGTTKELTQNRELFLIPPYPPSQMIKRKTVQQLCEYFPRVGRAYHFKNAFLALWEQESLQATNAFLETWCQTIEKTKLAPLKRAAEHLRKNKTAIIHFRAIQTDPVALERLYKKVLHAKTRTKGLKNEENFRNMVCFLCGKLSFPSPRVFLDQDV